MTPKIQDCKPLWKKRSYSARDIIESLSIENILLGLYKHCFRHIALRHLHGNPAAAAYVSSIGSVTRDPNLTKRPASRAAAAAAVVGQSYVEWCPAAVKGFAAAGMLPVGGPPRPSPQTAVSLYREY